MEVSELVKVIINIILNSLLLKFSNQPENKEP